VKVYITCTCNFFAGGGKSENGLDESNKTLVGVAKELSGLLEENGHSQLLLHCTISVSSIRCALGEGDQMDPCIMHTLI